ncbi:rod shape-determining protein RodA [Aureivirga sp. CE67]|uniref:rod shape-determining protein RodA n=1 Tax=Aureivirga sp. CE67 TaxID=1788983 RepID=UPI0018CACEDE|nr:rod shape-determining protein RodA [Aureivirga sp. CE67]
MRTKSSNIISNIDWLLILFYIALCFIGWVNIYAASTPEENAEILNFSTKYGKQLIFFGLSIPLILVILFIESKFYEQFASIFYLISMLTLIGLFVFGKTLKGATSWYEIGSFTLQPSEFAKAATALAIARLITDKQFDFSKLKYQLQTFLVILVPVILITLQPDPGSALVYLSFFFVFYREGLPSYYITGGIGIILLFIATLAFGYIALLITIFIAFAGLIFYLYKKKRRVFKRNLPSIIGTYLVISLYVLSVTFIFNNVFKQRHRDRFNIVLNKETDDKGKGYNQRQAAISIASGGMFGKGFLNGDRTEGGFVPEQDTDFIFVTIGEEWGFVGSVFVVLLFALFILRIVFVAERQKSRFSRIYGYSIASIFFFHFVINIGMVLKLLPTVGIPLPFFSYGGSSLWAFTILLFIFIRLDANRTLDW